MFDYPRWWARYVNRSGKRVTMYWYEDDKPEFETEHGDLWWRDGDLIRSATRPEIDDPRWQGGFDILETAR